MSLSMIPRWIKDIYNLILVENQDLKNISIYRLGSLKGKPAWGAMASDNKNIRPLPPYGSSRDRSGFVKFPSIEQIPLLLFLEMLKHGTAPR